MKRRLVNDKISIFRNGKLIIENSPASVQGDKIYSFERNLDIENGDEIHRKLPNGKNEVYFVEDSKFLDAGNLSNWTISVSKKGTQKKLPGSYTISPSGDNVQINIQSPNSIQQINNITSESVFQDLRLLVDEHVTKGKEEFLETIKNMEKGKGTNNFIDYYKKFISLTADHMQIFSPFIPALTSWLPS